MPRSTSSHRAAETSTSTDARPIRSFTSYASAMKYLNDRVNLERIRPAKLGLESFKLDRMRALLDELGSPHRELKFIHIAGSKGKGSTCEMLASSLSACGYTPGLYTSPHLIDLRERIRLSGEVITELAFMRALSQCRRAAAAIEARFGKVSYFELLTAVAILHFAEQAVDVAIMETGLGGRLDSTNVVTPEVCGLTSIHMEHASILGNSIEQIAREKAGIMKPGITAISVPQPPEVIEVFKTVAEEVGATLRVLGDDIDFSARFESAHRMGPHARICVGGQRGGFEHIAVPLPGQHQAANCALVLAILEKLRDRGFETPEREVAIGLAATPRQGRLECILESPRIYIDGAHNPESIRGLVQAVGSHIAYDSMVVIFGCSADKDVDAMLKEIDRGADKIIFTKSALNPRAMDPVELRTRFQEISGKMAQVEPTVKDAINTAAKAMGREDLICVTGSFYVAGEAKALVQEKKQAATKPS